MSIKEQEDNSCIQQALELLQKRFDVIEISVFRKDEFAEFAVANKTTIKWKHPRLQDKLI